MQLNDLINMMTPQVYQRLLTAVELGKWPDGVVLTEEQKSHSLQMVMLYQSRFNVDAQHMSVNMRGEIEIKSKQEIQHDFNDGSIIAHLKPEQQ